MRWDCIKYVKVERDAELAPSEATKPNLEIKKYLASEISGDDWGPFWVRESDLAECQARAKDLEAALLWLAISVHEGPSKPSAEVNAVLTEFQTRATAEVLVHSAKAMMGGVEG